jgi:4'-phosphopantetheinyl transferase
MKSNQVHIYFCHVNYPVSEDFFLSYYTSLPEFIRIKTDSFLKIEDKIKSILGKHLLLHGFDKMGIERNNIKTFDYQENNRPYLKVPASLDFNISHSDSLIICALSTDTQVGIDIERNVKKDLSIFKNQLSIQQWEAIEETANPTELFFQYWVQKESLIKACNTDVPFGEIEFQYNRATINKKTWYLHSINIDSDYSCCLATNFKADISIEEVSFT